MTASRARSGRIASSQPGQRHDREREAHGDAEPVEDPATEHAAPHPPSPVVGAGSGSDCVGAAWSLRAVARRRSGRRCRLRGRRRHCASVWRGVSCRWPAPSEPVQVVGGRRVGRATRRRRLRLGCGLAAGFLDGRRRVEPHQQHFAVPVERRGRPRLDDRERGLGRALDLRDARHRVAGREHAAHAGREQQVALADVGLTGDERQRQPVRVAGADRDRAHAAAIRLHRDRVLRVADQDRLGGARVDAPDLAEDALRIEHGLALEDAVGGAPVEQHAVAERVEVDVEYRRRRWRASRRRRSCRASRAAGGSLLERGEALQLQVREPQARGEVEILLAAAAPGPRTNR